MKPYYSHAGIEIFHGDCREIAPVIEYGRVLSDPPWGTDTATDSRRFSPARDKSWWAASVDRTQIGAHAKIHGDDGPFDPLPWVSVPAILWGANNFASRLPDSNGWLIWDKRLGLEEMAENGWPLGEAELAWTNVIGATRVFRNRWAGLVRSEEQGEFYHPTQKPIALMEWCINFLGRGFTILDPYMGAGATLIAAKRKGCSAIGIEIEEKYCEIAAKRLSQEVFDFGPGAILNQGKG